MKPLVLALVLCLLSCRLASQKPLPNSDRNTADKKPPFEIIDLTITPWVAGREEGGTGYHLKLTLTQAFPALDSVSYKHVTGVWTLAKAAKGAVYTAKISEKRLLSKARNVDANPTKDYGNQLPNTTNDEVILYYHSKNKPRRYIHKNPHKKPTLLYM